MTESMLDKLFKVLQENFPEETAKVSEEVGFYKRIKELANELSGHFIEDKVEAYKTILALPDGPQKKLFATIFLGTKELFLGTK